MMDELPKGRIAIKFGTNTKSSQTGKPQQPPSSLGKRPRSNHKAFGGGDSDSDNEHASGKHETITGFGAEGAENDRAKKEIKKEYVIARQPNRNWKADVKAQRGGGGGGGKNILPPEARAQRNGESSSSAAVETEPADQDKAIKWGLTVKEKTTRETDEPEESEQPAKGESEVDSKPNPEVEEPARTADDEAMDELLGRKPSKRQAAIIPSETDAYRRDAETAGVASTLEDYESMPVEEFGAALLRGMGWNGEERAPKPKEVKRRPNRLGLGAKELKGEEDLGGWNQNGGKKKRPRLDEYRRNEERKKDSRREDDSYKRERERERDRDRDRGSDRDRYRDRDRDRHHDRHRHREYHRK
jgi:hypothetical protein